MAYSTSPLTLKRMEDYLLPLRGGGELQWGVEPHRVRWFSYKLREALALLRTLPEEDIPEKLRGLPDYRIEVVNARTVRAVPKDLPDIEVKEAKTGRSTMETTQVTSLQNIVDRWTIRAPQEDRIYFPNTMLSGEQLLDLHEWASESGVIFFENAGALTLMPHEGNEDAAEFAWSPEDLEEDL